MAVPHGKNLKKSAVHVWDGDDWAAMTQADLAGGGFIIPDHDYIELTYVAAGNGVGEIETVVYKDGGSGGTTVATLTLAYNADDKLSSVTQT